MTEYSKADFEAYRKEQDEQAAKEQQTVREETAKNAARNAWIEAGGDAQAFEKNWPSIREQQLRDRVVDTDEQARDTQRRMGVSGI